MGLKIPQNKEIKGFDVEPRPPVTERSSVTEQGGCFSGFAPSRLVDGPVSRLWNSIAFKFGGTEGLVSALISPLTHSERPELIASIFFKEKAPELKVLADRYPAAVNLAVAEQTKELASPWKEFLKIVAGDRAAVLDAVRVFENIDERVRRTVTGSAVSVAHLRPRDGGHLLNGCFEHANNKDRLTILEAFDENPNLGSSRELGNLFLKLMARTTPFEREHEIYPKLTQMTEDDKGGAFLKVLFTGWLSEDGSRG